MFFRTNLDGTLGKGKVFNNVDQEFRSIAVVGLGRDGVGYNELEAIDEGMVCILVAIYILHTRLSHFTNFNSFVSYR